MIYQRALLQELQSLAKQYKVVTLSGPRQTGKTTLVRQAFPEKPYVNLESLEERAFAEEDPKKFLARFPKGAILDEIQRTPFLLSYIQVLVDEMNQKGFFILTGSHQFELHSAISQSLAGRTALLTLLPMSLWELQQADQAGSVDSFILRGGYPAIYRDRLDPFKAYSNYLKTYLERDLRQLISIKDLSLFQKFLKLLAGRIGQLVNMESLGNETGVSSSTIKHWISILEASYILFRLSPYHENFSKRVVKTPKFYFTDVGLATYLLGIETETQLERDPLRGQLIENLALLELIKARLNQGKDPNLYFFRDTHGHEVDILVQRGSQLIPIEVKSSTTFKPDFLKNLRFFKNLVPERVSVEYLIYTGTIEQTVHSVELLNIMNAHKVES